MSWNCMNSDKGRDQLKGDQGQVLIERGLIWKDPLPHSIASYPAHFIVFTRLLMGKTYQNSSYSLEKALLEFGFQMEFFPEAQEAHHIHTKSSYIASSGDYQIFTKFSVVPFLFASQSHFKLI